MKTAYLIHARDKMYLRAHVEKCVRSAFMQTCAPIEILLSDQGSTDGTRELLQQLAAEYKGPHTVRVLDCPDTTLRGMAGLNAHMAWAMEQTDADIVLLSSADDYALPERTARTLEAFERTGCDMVGTAMYFEDPATGKVDGRSAHTKSGWANVDDMVSGKMGGSSALAVRRSFWQRIQPIPALAGYDVYLPPLAVTLGGFWYVAEPSHVYVKHADVRNMGLEGVIRALPEAERRPVDEHRLFQTAGAWQWVLRRMQSLQVGRPDERSRVGEAVIAHSDAWLDTRIAMTVNRQAPQPFPI